MCLAIKNFERIQKKKTLGKDIIQQIFIKHNIRHFQNCYQIFRNSITYKLNSRLGASTGLMYSSTSTSTLNFNEYEYKYEYFYFSVLEYEYEYFQKYSSTSTSTFLDLNCQKTFLIKLFLLTCH